jgi:hypothetical protein
MLHQGISGKASPWKKSRVFSREAIVTGKDDSSLNLLYSEDHFPDPYFRFLNLSGSW